MLRSIASNKGINFFYSIFSFQKIWKHQLPLLKIGTQLNKSIRWQIIKYQTPNPLHSWVHGLYQTTYSICLFRILTRGFENTCTTDNLSCHGIINVFIFLYFLREITTNISRPISVLVTLLDIGMLNMLDNEQYQDIWTFN